MRPIPWDEVRHLLAIVPDDDTPALAPALDALREVVPSIRTTLLTTPRGARAARQLRWDGELLECEHDVDPMSVGGDEGVCAARMRSVVDQLRRGDYDAAIVLAGPDQSPHVWGYVAYLAGIGHRCGAPAEVGGAVLSHEVCSHSLCAEDRHVALLEAAGLPVAAGSRSRAETLQAADSSG